MLTKSQIAQEVEELTGIKPNLTKSVIDALGEIAAEEIEAGKDFSVPGVAKISYRYASARKKGEQYKKGQTRVGFGGIESVAEEDSPARKASVKLVATPAPSLKRGVPKKSDEAAQAAFMKSKAGKNVAGRKK